VHVWTINDPTEMQRFAALGVDGIITDRPDVAQQVLGA
jgi:glycerophosphoryl diester phosphodiesterase